MYGQNIGSLTWGWTISYSLDIRVLMWIAFFHIFPKSVDRLHERRTISRRNKRDNSFSTKQNVGPTTDNTHISIKR